MTHSHFPTLPLDLAAVFSRQANRVVRGLTPDSTEQDAFEYGKCSSHGCLSALSGRAELSPGRCSLRAPAASVTHSSHLSSLITPLCMKGLAQVLTSV
ncbi:hypothetical protein DPX16_20272 [Anabarilius grahami]|uniref:Uncharacterized protein n=1 Tax=Anabarilius grahami TaxID=495550 RepID=A0A3N0XEF2_ANAGA|nr:hypothetical protein DPX16_20272 [Anabarilius grahami]